MAFHNFDAVRSVQESRQQQASLEDEQITNIFLQQVEGLFGNKLEKGKLEKARSDAKKTVASEEATPSKKATPARQQQEDLIRVTKPNKDK